MWVTKLLISPVKIRIFCPKKSKFGPKMAFLFFLGQALPAHLVGGCGARAVNRKTPIYFIFKIRIPHLPKTAIYSQQGANIEGAGHIRAHTNLPTWIGIC